MNGNVPRTARSRERGSRTWIFQANPSKYCIGESLRAENEEYWNLNQHVREVAVGDRVLIWICGKNAGVYAVGTVLTVPIPMADSAKGQGYWLDKAAGRREKPRVRVRYDRLFVDRPLYKDFIECDPDLWNLAILRQPRGTNFAVSEAEWQALRVWFGDSAARGGGRRGGKGER
jgi:5-methylcytosine-specific restriction protein B